MHGDATDVTDERIERIRQTPEDQRTGEDQAILGIDNAITAAHEAMEAAGFDVDHLLLLFDVSESPDKNPDAPMAGAVILPHHPACAIPLLGGAIASFTGSDEAVVRMVEGGGDGPVQPGPLHQQ